MGVRFDGQDDIYDWDQNVYFPTNTFSILTLYAFLTKIRLKTPVHRRKIPSMGVGNFQISRNIMASRSLHREQKQWLTSVVDFNDVKIQSKIIQFTFIVF